MLNEGYTRTKSFKETQCCENKHPVKPASHMKSSHSSIQRSNVSKKRRQNEDKKCTKMEKNNTQPQRSYHKVNFTEKWMEAMDDQIIHCFHSFFWITQGETQQQKLLDNRSHIDHNKTEDHHSNLRSYSYPKVQYKT